MGASVQDVPSMMRRFTDLRISLRTNLRSTLCGQGSEEAVGGRFLFGGLSTNGTEAKDSVISVSKLRLT